MSVVGFAYSDHHDLPVHTFNGKLAVFGAAHFGHKHIFPLISGLSRKPCLFRHLVLFKETPASECSGENCQWALLLRGHRLLYQTLHPVRESVGQ